MAQYFNSFGESGLCKQGRLSHKDIADYTDLVEKEKIELTSHLLYLQRCKFYQTGGNLRLILNVGSFFKCHYTNAYLKINRIWHRKLCTQLRNINEFLRFHSGTIQDSGLLGRDAFQFKGQ